MGKATIDAPKAPKEHTKGIHELRNYKLKAVTDKLQTISSSESTTSTVSNIVRAVVDPSC